MQGVNGMKIFVSPETFKEYPNYKDAMKWAGVCEVDDSLKLGQIIIEKEEKERYLIEMTMNENETKITRIKDES